MEQAALGQLLARKELMVLATGGGIVSEPLTFDLILQSFYTIWLKAEPEEHMARVRGQGDLRPMADDRSAMAELRTILLKPRAAVCAGQCGGRYRRSQRGCRRRAPGRRGGAGAAAGSENVRAGVNYSRVPGAAQRFFAMRRSAIHTLRSSRSSAIRAIHPP